MEGGRHDSCLIGQQRRWGSGDCVTVTAMCWWWCQNYSDVLVMESQLLLLLLLLLLKESAVQGWERVIYTISVRRPQPHNTNL